LLEASIRVLLTEGMHALSQTRVAQEAGLRQSHLTYYFPTRVDLLKAVVEFADASIIGMVEGRPDALPQSLAELRDRLGAPVIDRKMPRLMLAMQVAADEEPGLHEWMRGFDARMQERLVAVMAGFGLRPSPRDFALFHASMIGIAVQNAWRHDDASAREARRLMHAAFDRLVRDAGGARLISGVEP
jgi:AcrR family transcriptional regulator